MYFTINAGYYNYPNPDKYSWTGLVENDMEEIREVIKGFPEIKELFSDRYNKGWTEYDKFFIYYELDIKAIRKLKILSLTDKKLKEKFKKLLTVISDKNSITVSEEMPDFSGIGMTTGTGGKSKEDAEKYDKIFDELKELMEE